jgi:hypothetical protein
MNRRQFLRSAGGAAVGLSLAGAGVAQGQQPARAQGRSNVEGMAYRELYCPAHFGNSYEVMGPNEMRDVLAEAKRWGFNAYGDWFDTADLKNPRNNPRKEYLLPQALWERKLGSFRIAQDLDFATDLVVTPNHVFLDQLTRELLADTSESRYFGQLLCPSIPKAREIILRNQRELFEDLRKAGVGLHSLSACPFDYGGCACERCRPWIVTFGKLFVEIHEIAKQFFPAVKARLIGWWWTREEHDSFKQWADAESPGRFVSLAAHLPYGEIALAAGLALPEGCELHAFVHIGYGDKASPRDVYGPWGPVVAATRIPATVKALESAGATGFMAYSEGVFDDVNKALLGGLSTGEFGDGGDVLTAYAERYLGATGADRKAWAQWIAQWGSPWEADTAAARRQFDHLSKRAKPSWRLAQLEAKLRLVEADAEVRSRTKWDGARLAAAERFFAEREKLERGIWGLGLVRHVLNDRYHQPDWFADWERQRAGKAGPAAAGAKPEA